MEANLRMGGEVSLNLSKLRNKHDNRESSVLNDSRDFA